MINIEEDNLKSGVLGLVIALVEIIRDALQLQAVRRMEGGSLNEEETERLGRALRELDLAIDHIKEEQGVGEAVQSVRDGLDDIVNDCVDRIANPTRWTNRELK
ncbi:MAG: gas vesicle protein K [Candidatus Euphemobacter frigidus]|nr:gas vesicle protein K [Candidatus Euphemobacter frigidus]MDP8274784.1 gas vesicle protein K [Candidatus Euphemobacter frigidus]